MAAPDTRQSNRIEADEPALPETAVPRQDDDETVSSRLDAALKNTLITVGTVWFVATLVAIGAFAMQLTLITTIAAFVVVTMMFVWLAGLSFLVAGWVTRRFDVIAVLAGRKTSTGMPGRRQRK